MEKIMTDFLNCHTNTWWSDGVEGFLLSAEFPYYRVSAGNWEDYLRKLADVGIDVISFYIPWNLHEYEEGLLDFSASSNDQRRNVKHFAELIRGTGMRIIAKPGPFICAEYHHGGIPDWLTTKYPEVIMKDCAGKTVTFFQDGLPLPYYCHPIYVDYVRRWYHSVTDEVLHDIQESGTLMAVQIENEIPYSNPSLADPFSWGYSEACVKNFQGYLIDKYKSAQNLNQLMKTKYRSFEEIVPPRPLKPYSKYSKENWLFLRDWIEFKEYVVSRAIEVYGEFVREKGIKSSFYHDLAMLENESPVNYRKIAEVTMVCPNFWFKRHPAYDAQSYTRTLGRAKLVKAVQKDRVCYCSESNWSWGSELEFTFLFSCLLSEVEGINIYTGVNGANAGLINEFPASTVPEPYPGQAPIGTKGEKTDKYYALERLAFFIRASGVNFVSTRQDNRIALVHYAPYTYPYLLQRWADYYSKGLSQVFTDVPEMNAWLNNLMEKFIEADLGHDIVDLEASTFNDLLKYEILFAPSYGIMDAGSQGKLVEYVRRGGHLFIFPSIPQFDNNFRSCENLKSALFGSISIEQLFHYHNFNWDGYGNMGTYYGAANLVKAYSPAKCYPVGRLIYGDPIAMEAKCGRGKVDWLGVNLPDLPEARRFLVWLAKKHRISPVIQVATENVHGLIRQNDHEKFIFLVNRGTSRFSGPIHFGKASKEASLHVSIPSRRITVLHLRDREVISCLLPGEEGYVSSRGNKTIEVKSGSAVFIKKSEDQIRLMVSGGSQISLEFRTKKYKRAILTAMNKPQDISERFSLEEGVLDIKVPYDEGNHVYEVTLED